MSTDLSFWQSIIQTGIVAGAFVTIATIVYKVTKEFRDMRGDIRVLEKELGNLQKQLDKADNDIQKIESWNMEESRRKIETLRNRLAEKDGSNDQ